MLIGKTYDISWSWSRFFSNFARTLHFELGDGKCGCWSRWKAAFSCCTCEAGNAELGFISEFFCWLSIGLCCSPTHGNGESFDSHGTATWWLAIAESLRAHLSLAGLTIPLPEKARWVADRETWYMNVSYIHATGKQAKPQCVLNVFFCVLLCSVNPYNIERVCVLCKTIQNAHVFYAIQ